MYKQLCMSCYFFLLASLSSSSSLNPCGRLIKPRIFDEHELWRWWVEKSLSGLVDFGLHFVVMFETFRFISICKTRYQTFYHITYVFVNIFCFANYIYIYIYIYMYIILYFEYTHTSLVCNVCHTNLNPRLTALNINIAKYMPLQ